MYLKSVYKGVVHIRRVPQPPEISYSASIGARDLKNALATSLWPSAFINLSKYKKMK